VLESRPLPFDEEERRAAEPVVQTVGADRIVVELPGVDAANVQISAAPRELLIAGNRVRPDGDGRYQQLEIDYGPFQRRIALAETVDPAEVTASYDRGLLTVVLPLVRRPDGPVPIEVRTEP
jgi:HSP20 family protein